MTIKISMYQTEALNGSLPHRPIHANACVGGHLYSWDKWNNVTISNLKIALLRWKTKQRYSAYQGKISLSVLIICGR